MSDDRSIHDQLRITCADAVERVTDYLDDALASRDLEDFTVHLQGCQACTVYLGQIRQTIELAPTARDEVQVDRATLERLLTEFDRRRGRDDS